MTEVSQAITRKSASNLALAFILLPKAKREGMAALYAFCREIDDIADEDSVPETKRREALKEWRADIELACAGGAPRLPVIRELQPSIVRHRLPLQLFLELIEGVEMDLEIKRYQNYSELEEYCYRVASVVGLLSIEIFGYQNPACRDYAVYLGKALQLTNIIRDVRNDAERGRIYLPLDELARFQVDPEEILRFRHSDRFERLAGSVAEKAHCYYDLARKTLPAEDRRSMATAELMGSVYWEILLKLEENRFPVFSPKPAKLSKSQKIFLIFRSWVRMWTGSLVPAYGTR